LAAENRLRLELAALGLKGVTAAPAPSLSEILARHVVTPMLQLFKTSGLPLSTRREGQIVDVTIWLF
jgi:hypothetical protein